MNCTMMVLSTLASRLKIAVFNKLVPKVDNGSPLFRGRSIGLPYSCKIWRHTPIFNIDIALFGHSYALLQV
jgi:hypothetical protein